MLTMESLLYEKNVYQITACPNKIEIENNRKGLNSE